MEEEKLDSSEADWGRLLSVLQLIAERGRRIRREKMATTVDKEPLDGSKSTAVANPPAQNASV